MKLFHGDGIVFALSDAKFSNNGIILPMKL